MVGLKGFTRSLPITNLTFCSDFGSSAQSQGFLRSDLVEEIRHLPFYNAGIPNIRIVTSVIGRAQRSTYWYGLGPTRPIQNDTRVSGGRSPIIFRLRGMRPPAFDAHGTYKLPTSAGWVTARAACASVRRVLVSVYTYQERVGRLCPN